MNAIEFVKNYGIDEARDKVQDCEFLDAEFFNWMGNDVCVSDLKKIVDAFELVESYGSIKQAKYFLSICADWIKPSLEQAINLVEQCQ